MQAVLAIPGSETLRNYGEPADVLMRPVAGVPLLTRVLATAARAGVDSVVVIWPKDMNPAILESCAQSHLLKEMPVDRLVRTRAFDPRGTVDWATVAWCLEEKFLWVPWNWATHKRALAELPSSSFPPLTWEFPVLLQKRAVLTDVGFRVSSGRPPEGVSITSQETVAVAERFLVAHSGKPTDGIYSNFNRRLCWPAVRFLSHTGVTPNALTLAGLVVAISGAFLYARGSYASYVAGALLFFLSGLFDEMDGMMARIKFLESAFGTWFEGFVDNVTYLAVFAGIIVGLDRQYGSWAVQYGSALMIGCVLSVVVIGLQRKLATSRDRPHEYSGRMNQLMEADSSNLVSRVVRQIHIFVKKGVLVHYLLIFTVLGGLRVFLWLAALGSNLTWIITLYFTRRFFQRAPLEAAVHDMPRAA